jgi:hypothetical protein
MERVVSATARPLYSLERYGTLCIGSWMVQRAALDACRKSRLPPEFDPRTFQVVASRFTDYVNPTPNLSLEEAK